MAEHDDSVRAEIKFESEGSVATGFSLAERLEENFWFLMSLVEKDVKDLTTDYMRNVVAKWLLRLTTFTDAGNVSKMAQRNVYLGQLIDCLHEKRFGWPFNVEPPEQGDLPELNAEPQLLLEEGTETPEWLEEVMQKAEQAQNRPGAMNFETYLSTKLFDNERGACAYIAVSATNEGDKAAWVRLNPNERREQQLRQMYDEELEQIKQAIVEQESLIELESVPSFADSIDLGSEDE